MNKQDLLHIVADALRSESLTWGEIFNAIREHQPAASFVIWSFNERQDGKLSFCARGKVASDFGEATETALACTKTGRPAGVLLAFDPSDQHGLECDFSPVVLTPLPNGMPAWLPPQEEKGTH